MSGIINSSSGLQNEYFAYLLPLVLRTFIGLLVLVPVTTFYLEPEDFGLFALISALVLPIQALASSSSRWVIGGNTFKGMTKESYRELIFNLLLFESLVRSIMVFVYFLFGRQILALGLDEVTAVNLNLFYLALVASWFGSIWPTVSYLMIIQKRAALHAAFSAGQVVVHGLVCVVALWWLGWGVETLFYALVAANMLSLIFELFFIKGQIRTRGSISLIRNIVGYFFRSIPGGGIEIANGVLEKALVAKYVSLSGLGLYSHSQQYSVILKSATQAFSNLLTPRTLQVYSEGADPQEISALLHYWYGFLSIVGLGVVLFADEFIALLTHGKFTDAAPLLVMWVFLSFSTTVGIPYAQYLIAFNRTNILMYTQVLPSAIGLAVLWPVIMWFGYYGAALILLSVSLVSQFLRRWAALRIGMSAINERMFLLSFALVGAAWAVDWLAKPSLINEILLFLTVSTVYFWVSGLFFDLKKFAGMFLLKRNSAEK